MKTRIAFVCQRYGQEVNGGSEQYCRQVAEKLAEEYDVTVYTTCAFDYITWANHYPPGTEQLNNVTVKRFPVTKTRNRYRSALAARALRVNPFHSEKAEWHWIDLQGPYCPELIETLKAEADCYQTVFFMTYLYYTAVRGLMLDLPNAVLIPTAHDEPPVYFHCYDKTFSKAKGFVWLTSEERAFATGRFPQIRDIPSVMAGIGIEETIVSEALLPQQLINQPYFLYAGRIARSKGCGEMLEYFRMYKKKHPGNLKLVLVGNPVMRIPKEEDILLLGYISEQEKAAVMANAKALVLHSRYESLSMVVLESMQLGRPVLVTAESEVLKGHCERSKAGFSFSGYPEYEEKLNILLNDSETEEKMGQNGRKYVAENYRWERVVDQYKKMINKQQKEKEKAI